MYVTHTGHIPDTGYVTHTRYKIPDTRADTKFLLLSDQSMLASLYLRVFMHWAQAPGAAVRENFGRMVACPVSCGPRHGKGGA